MSQSDKHPIEQQQIDDDRSEPGIAMAIVLFLSLGLAFICLVSSWIWLTGQIP